MPITVIKYARIIPPSSSHTISLGYRQTRVKCNIAILIASFDSSRAATSLALRASHLAQSCGKRQELDASRAAPPALLVAGYYDQVRMQAHEFSGQCRNSLREALCPAYLHVEVLHRCVSGRGGRRSRIRTRLQKQFSK